jgi:hypothetical protein
MAITAKTAITAVEQICDTALNRCYINNENGDLENVDLSSHEHGGDEW